MNYDVVVVGGGHAGCEAAAVAARIGASVALITHQTSDLGQLSCNPAIGGIGKGHLVREIDALDGIMGIAADKSAIHYRLLNRTKGAAVQGPRAQVDRQIYAGAVRSILSASGVRVIEGQAVDFLGGPDVVEGVILENGDWVRSAQVVISAGTFLGGRIHTGAEQTEGGRVGERSSAALLSALQRLGIRFGHFRTGTPPRLDGRSIDWARLEAQPGDAEPVFLSSATLKTEQPQISCVFTRTNERTHEVIRSHLSRSPTFNGTIDASGPRHCPSIEDKINRFADRSGHQIFLEPETLTNGVIYPNGISMALPAHLQQEILRTIAGFETVRITRAGYAITYACCAPGQIDPTLAVRNVAGLFLAGQINGTTGYEEAAAQGLVAGMNAARSSRGQEAIVIPRTLGYLGVLLSDIAETTLTEPYRMFTARAEHRLNFSIGTAETRLAGLGNAAGAIGSQRHGRIARRIAEIDAARSLLKTLVATPGKLASAGLDSARDAPVRTAYELLSMLHMNWQDCERIWPETSLIDRLTRDVLENECRYAPYVAREARRLQRLNPQSQVVS